MLPQINNTQYEIGRVKPITLVSSQSTVEELEKDRKALGKLEVQGF